MSEPNDNQLAPPAAAAASPTPQMIHGRVLGPLEAQISGRALSCFSAATLTAMGEELSKYKDEAQEKHKKIKNNDALLLKAVIAQRAILTPASATPTAVLAGSLKFDHLDCFSFATYSGMYKDLRKLRTALQEQQEKMDDVDAKLLVLVRAWRKPNVYVFPKGQIPDYSQAPWIFGDKIFTSTPGNTHSRALPTGQAYGRWERVRIHGLPDEELNDEELQKSISQDHSIMNDHEPVPCDIFVAATHELRRSIIRPRLNSTAAWQNWVADMNRKQPLGTSDITVQMYNSALGNKAPDDNTGAVNYDEIFVKTGTLPDSDPRVRYTGPVADPDAESEDDEDCVRESVGIDRCATEAEGDRVGIAAPSNAAEETRVDKVANGTTDEDQSVDAEQH